ncbi:MAG: S8 family serine peptidase [Nanoarchaeota archaeon]
MRKKGSTMRFTSLVLVLGAVMLTFLFTLSTSSGQLSVDSCSVLNESAILTEDINATGSCFSIIGNDIEIDCQLHTIQGDGTGIGFSLYNNSNILIRNCIVENFETGIDITDSFVGVYTILVRQNSKGIITRGDSYLDTETNSIKENALANLENTNGNFTIAAYNNWWGTADPGQIALTIIGNVSFVPFLALDPYSDDDADTIPLFSDNCPAVPNPDQGDEDGDGLGNVCDNCADNFNPLQGDLDMDAAGDACDLDDDADGICDFGLSVTRPLPANLALNRPVTASNSVPPNVPEFAVDSDLLTFLAMVGDPPQDVTVDLESAQQIERVSVFFNDSASRAFDYNIEVSTDGTSYAIAATVRDNDFTENHLSFPALQARYVRLSLLDYDYEKDDVRINEIEVYGSTTLCTGGSSGRDVCPSIFNPGQEDSDNDTVGDVCDNCLLTPNVDQTDSDNDGKGDGCDVNVMLGSFSFDPQNPGELPNITEELLTDQETGYFIIQYAAGMGQNITDEIAGRGGQVKGYFNTNGMIVQVAASLGELRSLDAVRYADIYQPVFKIEPPLYDLYLHGGPSGDILSLDVYVYGNSQAVINYVLSLGGTAVHKYLATDIQYDRVLVVNITGTKLANLSHHPDIEYIELNFIDQPELDVATKITDVRRASNQPNILGLTGAGQIIGHRDTGVDTGNATTLIADLAGRVLNDSGPWRDTDGHGTHTLGIAIGNGANSGGRIRGVAPGATAIHSPFAGSPLESWTNAYNRGARIHTNSWGNGSGTTYSSLESEADTITNTNQDLLLVKSAGNNGPGAGSITSPTASKNLIAVANSENERPERTAANNAAGAGVADNRNHLRRSSSAGLTADNRIKPDVTAPGTWILSLQSTAQANIDHCDVDGDGVTAESFYANLNYTFCTGTSMAAPHVAGMGALIREYLISFKHMVNPSGMLVKAFIINGAQDMPDTGVIGGGGVNRGTGPIPNNDEGWGRVNLTHSIMPSDLVGAVDFYDSFNRFSFSANGERKNFTFRFSSERPIAATLVWYDLPAAAATGGGVALINDLDMEMISPSGTWYKGGNFAGNFVGGITQSGIAGKDSRNTVEKIIVRDVEDGFYNFSIRAHSLQAGSTQTFALVVSQLLGLDAANRTNVTHYFPVGNKVYAEAIGLKNNTQIELVVVANRPVFKWNSTVQVTNGASQGVGGFKFITQTLVQTTNNGTLPDPTEIWDTAGKENEVWASNGMFNIFVNYGPGHPIYFNKNVDVIDYHKKVGFRVGIANSSNTLGGNFSDNFTYGSPIFIKGVGFEPGNVTVYAVKDINAWVEDAPFADVVEKKEGVIIGNDGFFTANVWDAPEKTETGDYDLVVDVNNDGKYQASIDVIDGKTMKGFVVSCKPGEVCGAVAAADASRDVQDDFNKGDPVFAIGNLYISPGLLWVPPAINFYKVFSNSPVEDLNGAPLVDVTGAPTPINAPKGQFININTQIWSSADREDDYELILDVDNDGIFNISTDLYDPNGFVVTREIKDPRIAVDSQGSIHVVALENEKVPGYPNLKKTNVLYAKVPAGSVKMDFEHPELFDWSESQAVVFRTISENYGGTVYFPDIAVDANDEPYIIYSRWISEFQWLIIRKLDKNGNRDTCYDRSDQLTPPAPDKSNCDGNGLDLLIYHWDDFEDIKLNWPTIAVDKTTNQPVISAEVSMIYPDAFYYTQIYPLCFIGYQPIFIGPLMQFGIIPYFPVLQAGVVTFYGDSLQVARRVPGSAGTAQWPYSVSQFPDAARRYGAAATEVNACLWDVATSGYRTDDNWKWITVSQVPRLGLYYDTSKVDTDKDGNIHVVFRQGSNLNYSKIVGYAPDFNIKIDGGAPPALWFPWLDVDLEGRGHVAWQSGSKVYYTIIDPAGSAGTKQLVANLNSLDSFSRPSVAADGEGDPHISWKDKGSDSKDKLMYRKGENTGGSVSFLDPATILVDAGNFTGASGQITYPVLDTNKLAQGKDWEDKVTVGWIDIQDLTFFKVKQTLPHVTLLLILDGIDKEFLDNNLQNMPNLAQLINDNPILDASVLTPFPGTTMSTQAAMFTGVKPKTHHVIGDNFKASQAYYFMPESGGSPNDADEVNNVLQSPPLSTVFDSLTTAKRSKAGIPAIIRKGIQGNRPDHNPAITIDFSTGTVDESDRTQYLQDLKNNDDQPGNDVAELVVAYLLTHDHGISDNPTASGLHLAALDQKIGDIIQKLKDNNIYNDTIFIITSDHGLVDTIKDDNHSLSFSDIPALDNPQGIALNPLFPNGRVAYSDDGLDAAKVYYNNSVVNMDSPWYQAISRVIVKQGGAYYDYSFNGMQDVLTPATDQFLEDMTYGTSPNMILIASPDYYFQTPQEAISGDQEIVPFLITGPGFGLFSRGNNNIPGQLEAVDVAPTLAFFTGGQEAVDLMSGIDGENFYDPALVIQGGSPVDFHLYDSLGRHVGPDEFGNIEVQIPSADYSIDPETGKITISLLQAPDTYLLDVDSYGWGKFGLSVRKKTGNETFDLTFPRTSISPNSFANLDLSTMEFRLDFEGDGTFERMIDPPESIIIVQDEQNNRATARILTLAAREPASMDLSRATGVIFDVKNKQGITDGQIDVQRFSDQSLTQTGFYTFGNYVVVNISDNVLTNAKFTKLTIIYPEYLLFQNNLSEKSLAVYDKQTGQRFLSSVDGEKNRVTVLINSSGEYLLASTDLIPMMDDITVTPQATNIINAPVQVSVKISDDSLITGANVTLGNRTEPLVFNSGSGRYEAVITGPDISATYPVFITAQDDTENIVMRQAEFKLDLDAPVIRILSPRNISYTTNRIMLSFFTDEVADLSLSIDGSPSTPLNSTASFKINTLQLTLPGGNHSLTINASDVFANNGIKTVSFEVEKENVLLSDLEVPMFEKPGIPVPIQAVAANTMMDPEQNVLAQLLLNGNVSQQTALNISGESSVNVSFLITPPEGRYTLTLKLLPLPEERVILDNELSQEILITSKIPVLIIADDPAANQSVYQNAISQAGGLGYDYLRYDVSQKGPPSFPLLDGFPLVLWLTGGSQTLTPLEINSLKSYLDTRGNLLIFSNDMAAELADTDFYKNYLAAEFRRRASSTTIEGAFRDAIGAGMLFSIFEPGDEIKPRIGATESFRYSGGESAAIKYDSGVFKTVYFTFGLEDVNDTESRQMIMDRTLGYFNIDIQPPGITNIEPGLNATFPINTSTITLSLQTNEFAECRYSDTITLFGSMSLFASTNSTQHSTQLNNLANGNNYLFFINCRDVFSNENKQHTAGFFIYNRTFFPPVLQDVASQSADENTLVQIPLIVSDPENDPLSLTLSDVEIVGVVPIASRFTLQNSTFRFQSNFNDAGIYKLRVTASDGFESVSRDFFLTINNVNRAPVLASIGNRQVFEDSLFTLDADASDPDNDNLIFTDDSGLFAINPATGLVTFTPKNEQVGSHLITLTVSDSNLSDSEVFTLTVVNTNDPPIAAFIPPQAVQEGNPFVLQVNASDPDNNTLTYSDDTDLFNISQTGLVSFTPTNADVGTHIINITVSDSIAAVSRLLNLIVTETNAAPIITSMPYIITVNPGGILEINVTACDPDVNPACTLKQQKEPPIESINIP